jgi:hypothetical protein
MLFYGFIKKGTKPVRKISLTSNNDIRFKILKIETDTDAVTTDINTIEVGKNYELIAKLDPSKLNGRLNGKMKIHTDNKEQRIVEVGISGIVRE